MNYPPGLGRVILTMIVVATAAVVAVGLWNYYIEAPWTRDARVRADVVQIAPDVSGLVDAVLVHDNTIVHKGDVLFRVDRQRFVLALEQAEAAVSGRQAVLEQARREVERSQDLREFASRQRVELDRTAANQAEAACRQALADRDLAKLNLERSEIKASVNGVISNLSLQPGDYVASGKPVMALINTDSIRVEGYFEETKIPNIKIGDSAMIHMMGRPNVFYGTVDSIAGGIEDRERTEGSGLLANINPTFTWVRLAQRVPVRIKLKEAAAETPLIVGQTATVQILTPSTK
ncbi:HlyD family secretion protein [Bradyrhizobium sp. INPA01-394B]|uniref:HlyD family secretion protein n=2 Tax=Bradyrhizobium campsiandrae TaxID=1729892 RepID=A0ABR7U4X4_9BRAD|nr:HlyD family secretion protein [Bradyrhizobium campsiandrae]MBC9979042.1 HlyD family secretion protein [Bradyrhizobium campsiandrae]